MDTLAKIILVLVYPLLLLARLLNALLGRDPLRLREPRGDSLWIARDVESDSASYFSEASAAEGRGHGGVGGLARAPLKILARLYAPPRSAPTGQYSAGADREQGIPDEVYTLW
ncbi:MAG TPA: hypothetical protein VI454_03210 [Verrucomicrobiae bacterium]|jgi:hypothetical protein